MKPYDIKQFGRTTLWIISVKPSKRAEVAESFRELDYLNAVDIYSDTKTNIQITYAGIAEAQDYEEVEAIVKRITAERILTDLELACVEHLEECQPPGHSGNYQHHAKIRKALKERGVDIDEPVEDI